MAHVVKSQLKKMVELSKDNMVKARFYKSIGNLPEAQKYAKKEFDNKIKASMYSAATK